MSTRSQIGFYKNKETPIDKFEALLYRHSDGYPAGVLPDILPFLSWWRKARGIGDLEYCSARLLQYLCNEYDKHSREIGEKIEFTGTLGHGVCKILHGDIEYFYKIYPNKVEVYDVPFQSEEESEKDWFGNWKLIHTIDLEKDDIDKVLKNIKE